MLDCAVTVLTIYTKISALVSVNGVLLGETSPRRAVCVPVSGDGDYYAVAYPLDNADGFLYAPRAMKLSFAEGALVSSGAKAVVWQCGTVEAVIELSRMKPERPICPPSELDAISPVLDGKKLTLSLVRDGDMYLFCEDERGRQTTFTLGGGENGSLFVERICGDELICVHVEYKEGERLLLFDGSLTNLLDIFDDRALISDGLPCSLKKLDTHRHHEERVRYDRAKGIFFPLNAERGFFTHERPKTDGGGEAALALFDAVRLGITDEAMALLTPELRSMLDMQKLREFIGESTAARLPRSDASGKHIGALRKRGEGEICDAELFALEFENGLISNIEKI